MVSPSTRVPARKATPSTTAEQVASRRRLWAPMDLRVVRHIGAQLPRARHALEHALGGRGLHVVDDPAVGQEHDGVGVGRGRRVVGDHDDGLAHVVDGLPHEGEDLAAAAGVEVAGRLVGEDDLGPAGQRPGHGDPLLLAARQLGRAVLQPVAEADGGDDPVEPAPVGLPAGQVEREGDVLGRRQRRQQVVGLEDEADAVAPQPGERLLGQRPEVDVAHVGPAGGRCRGRPCSASASTCPSRTGP